jgi:hypothetical protein
MPPGALGLWARSAWPNSAGENEDEKVHVKRGKNSIIHSEFESNSNPERAQYHHK